MSGTAIVEYEHPIEVERINDDVTGGEQHQSDGGVRGQPPSDDGGLPSYSWMEDHAASENYRAVGALLNDAGELYRKDGYGNGLLLIREDGKVYPINSADNLAPILVDRIALRISLEGKSKGSKLSAAHMKAMLRSDSFLDQFSIVDQVSTVPAYLPDFTLTAPGYNDGGSGHRHYHVGEAPRVYDSMDRIHVFLDVMEFATDADRTNAVAAALTVTLRHHWPGAKPIIVSTATKSQAGKDTVILFASGLTRLSSISYQSTDWALERCFVGTLNHDADVGVVVVENARLNRRDRFISSAFIERFTTDSEPFLFSTGTGPAQRRRNDIVIAVSTNFGTVSEDIMNRSLPIHLTPVGNVADRESEIGNPKLEYLPQNTEHIAAELRGMIERWKDSGQPLDKSVRHPFSEWAAVIGGILKVNGFEAFLENYGMRRVADDPIREGIALLGVRQHGEEWQRPDNWVLITSELGLVKQIIPEGDRDGLEARKRGLGKVLSAHERERFSVETDAEYLTLELQRKRGRFGEKNVHVRYRFIEIENRPKPLDEDA